MLRQYRKLDDQIITRLNRASAQLRDQSRVLTKAGSSSTTTAASGIDGMCLNIWNEMMGESSRLHVMLCCKRMQGGTSSLYGLAAADRLVGWAHRQTLLSYCLKTVGTSLETKKPSNALDERLVGGSAASASSMGQRERGWREEEALVSCFRLIALGSPSAHAQAIQLGNEESIEAIIRKRSLDGEFSARNFLDMT